MLGSNVSVGQCLAENQLFDESVEDLAYVAGLSTVEAKGEFVEVALQMHFTHLPLVSRSQPALQQRGNQGTCANSSAACRESPAVWVTRWR